MDALLEDDNFFECLMNTPIDIDNTPQNSASNNSVGPEIAPSPTIAGNLESSSSPHANQLEELDSHNNISVQNLSQPVVCDIPSHQTNGLPVLEVKKCP